jgi:hypothetical protein
MINYARKRMVQEFTRADAENRFRTWEIQSSLTSDFARKFRKMKYSYLADSDRSDSDGSSDTKSESAGGNGLYFVKGRKWALEELFDDATVGGVKESWKRIVDDKSRKAEVITTLKRVLHSVTLESGVFEIEEVAAEESETGACDHWKCLLKRWSRSWKVFKIETNDLGEVLDRSPLEVVQIASEQMTQAKMKEIVSEETELASANVSSSNSDSSPFRIFVLQRGAGKRAFKDLREALVKLERMLSEASDSRRKSDSRRFTLHYGFMEQLSIVRQVKLFLLDIDMVIASHGAGLGWIPFLEASGPRTSEDVSVSSESGDVSSESKHISSDKSAKPRRQSCVLEIFPTISVNAQPGYDGLCDPRGRWNRNPTTMYGGLSRLARVEHMCWQKVVSEEPREVENRMNRMINEKESQDAMSQIIFRHAKDLKLDFPKLELIVGPIRDCAEGRVKGML